MPAMSGSAGVLGFDAFFINSFSDSSDAIPTNPASGWPLLNNITVGIFSTLNLPAVLGISSTFAFNKITSSFISSETFSKIGASIEHGSHHVAKKSTKTNLSVAFNSLLKFSSVNVSGILFSVYKLLIDYYIKIGLRTHSSLYFRFKRNV